MDRALDRAAGARPIPGNRVTLLQDGPEVYRAMLELIEGAERWLHFENYIIRADQTGWRFAEALAAKARSGVPVRLIYDWLGSIATPGRYWKYLREAGVEVRRFNPPSVLKLFQNISRDHRKLVVADGARSILGGLCIGDEWAGDPGRGILPWRDTAVSIHGPAVHALDASFAGAWRVTGRPIPDAESRPEVPPAGEAEVRVVVGEPGRERAYRVIEYLAAGSNERLWITDAYLVPPPRLLQVLVEAAADGADIRLLVPGTSDLPLVRNLTRIGYRELLKAGVRIFEWDGPMLHAKTMVADGAWARIGTSNLNASSLLGNYEIDVLIEDADFARAMEAQFRRDIAQSLEVERRRYRAPGALSQVMPTALQRHRPSTEPASLGRSRRQFRGNAAVAMRTVVSAARRAIFAPVSVLLVVLGSLFLVLPRAMGYVFGALCVWFAIAAGLEAVRRRG